MSSEPPAAAEAPGTGNQPELRASHEDRDQVVEILRVAAGDGRLTAAELDERLEAALTARTHSDLATLTADLPAAGQQVGIPQRAKELVRIDHMGGNVKRAGRWVVPQQMEIHSVGGNVKLDFTDAVITQPTLRIEAKRLGGHLVLITKPGIEVDADGVRALGGSVKVPPPAPGRPVILRVEVSGEAWGGNLVVRPPRRAFWRWLLGK